MTSRKVTFELPKGRIFLLASASLISAQDHAGSWVVTGSHGGLICGQRAASAKVGLAVFNDAGGGKEDAGFAGLAALQNAGIPAATVSHDSGRIGDVEDMWDNGIISRVNQAAASAGMQVGHRLKHALEEMLT